jgi:hypothetical protein
LSKGQIIGLSCQARLKIRSYIDQMKNTRFRTALFMVLLAIMLSSCGGMIGRLLSAREQMCEFDDYVSMQIAQGVVVSLHTPVLLESDVYQLLDALPTSRTDSEDGIVASYIFEQVHVDTDGLIISTGEEIEFQLFFVASDKGPLLSGMRSPEIPAELLEYVLPMVAASNEFAQQACHVPVNPLSASVMVEINREMLELLPTRSTAVSWLKPSSESEGNNDDLVYEFRLRGEPGDERVARLDIDYDQAGEAPTAIEASFTRYQAHVDVPNGTMRMKLKQPQRTSL